MIFYEHIGFLPMQINRLSIQYTYTELHFTDVHGITQTLICLCCDVFCACRSLATFRVLSGNCNPSRDRYRKPSVLEQLERIREIKGARSSVLLV